MAESDTDERQSGQRANAIEWLLCLKFGFAFVICLSGPNPPDAPHWIAIIVKHILAMAVGINDAQRAIGEAKEREVHRRQRTGWMGWAANEFWKRIAMQPKGSQQPTSPLPGRLASLAPCQTAYPSRPSYPSTAPAASSGSGMLCCSAIGMTSSQSRFAGSAGHGRRLIRPNPFRPCRKSNELCGRSRSTKCSRSPAPAVCGHWPA
jgi:hypothetical protein